MARIQSMVGQKIVIYNQDNKVLILKRSMTSHFGGGWDLPGGGMLLNESPQQCLEREIYEETGLQVSGICPMHTATKEYPDGTHAFYVGYQGTLNSPSEVVLSHEHDEYLWIDPNTIEQYNLAEYRAETVKKSINITPHTPLK